MTFRVTSLLVVQQRWASLQRAPVAGVPYLLALSKSSLNGVLGGYGLQIVDLAQKTLDKCEAQSRKQGDFVRCYRPRQVTRAYEMKLAEQLIKTTEDQFLTLFDRGLYTRAVYHSISRSVNEAGWQHA